MTKRVYGSRITTPIGRISYPFIFEKATPLDPSKEPKYEVTLYIPKNEDLSILRSAIETCGRDAFGTKWPGQDRLKHPTIRCGDEENMKKPGHPAAGHWIIRARTNSKPMIVDGARKEIVHKDSVYGGCHGRLNVTPASYNMAGSWGVALLLNAVQKTGEGEKFSGSQLAAEDAFSVVENAEVASMDDHF